MASSIAAAVARRSGGGRGRVGSSSVLLLSSPHQQQQQVLKQQSVKVLLASSSSTSLRSGWKPTTTTTGVLRHFSASSSSSVSPIHVHLSAEEEQVFMKRGILDERGLTQFDTLHEMVTRSCEVFASKNLFATYNEFSKEFEWMTYFDYSKNIELCRAVLQDLDISANKKVGIISNNRWEWACIAAASYSLNANLVPMYEAQLPGDWTYIVNDANIEVLFCATQDIYSRVQKQVVPNASNLKTVLCLDAPLGETHSLQTAMQIQADKMKAAKEAGTTCGTTGADIVAPTPDDLANLIYTSGTTGKPKGVELTHNNFVSNVKSAARTMVSNPMNLIRHDDVSLAFLPWAHSYGQTCELWMSISHGASMGIGRGVQHILDDLQLVKPTVLFAVPTLYKKVYDGVNNLIENSSPIRKALMTQALKLGRKNVNYHQHGIGPAMSTFENMQYKILDGIVLNKIRARFGGRLRHSFVAGAACPIEVLNFMDNIGITVCEGYGLTETSPIITINTPEQRSVGSVGRPIGGVTVHIIDPETQQPVVSDGEEGEICCVGPNVMRGYHNNETATADVLSVPFNSTDGKARMFHTGDLGCMNSDGYVKVTGRLKEQYKLENGKYVVPTPIEESIGLSRFIQQVVLSGANRPYNIALLVPDTVAIRTELKLDEKDVSDDELVNDKRVRTLIDKEIQQHCTALKKFEIPQGWIFVAPFTTANNMLTPKMSIRRHKVLSTYSTEIAMLYGDENIIIPPAAVEDNNNIKEDDHAAAAAADNNKQQAA